MSTKVEVPCCSPATTESVAVVRDKVSDARADILIGEGAILKSQGDYTSAILQDSCATTASINANIDRGVIASMSHADKYGLANINTTRAEADRVSAQVDRAHNDLSRDSSNSFARLSAQGEAGFYRTGVAIAAADKQTVQSEISLGKAINAGFTDVGANMRDSYARLSEQNCDIKSAIAAAQAAAAQCCCEVKEEVLRNGKELGLQAAQNFGASQVEATKNTAAIQLQAAAVQKESLVEQARWFAAAEKTAFLNKADIEAKLAACCCELKEAVNGTASATQALIQANETTRLRDALSAATTESALLKLRREEHHHYSPYHYHHDRSRRGSRS